ncbi:MAG: c-type cytochrome [Deltaproteobacteria bacterium]|nr:c-type cytochrome [Deltaproteobacteria bacterium]
MITSLRLPALAGLVGLAACGAPAPAQVDAAAGADAPRDAAAVPDAMPDAMPLLPPLPDPARIAGPLTLDAWGAQPFLTPAPIDEVLQGGFSIGREFFIAAWVAAPSAQRPNLDGLGPLFHATSCAACHPATGRPASLGANGAVAPGLLFRLAGPGGAPDPIFGGQLQPSGLAGAPAEATITYAYAEAAPPGITPASARPVFAFATEPSYGALAATTRALPRMSPHLAGMGLLELVPDAAIVAREDPLDADGDGISGRAARLPGGAIGRFGWKAVQPSLRGQTTAAFAADIGIASEDRADDCTAAQPACLALPNGGAPEIASADVRAVDTFQRYLGVPRARRGNADPVIARGYALFVAARCIACHAQTLTTGDAPDALAHVDFHPYTDLLLHDMGPGLADPLGEGAAAAAEWRTPPLWGLGLVAADPAARFLHDGRAATLADAIRWHGGEAEVSRAAFAALSPDDAAALLAFVASL